MFGASSLLLALAVALSGCAALAYQATWGRMLERDFGFGVSDVAIATILGTFFLGLGLGSAWGGRLSRRAKDPVRTYALLELGVAGWAVLSLLVAPHVHVLYAGLGESSFTVLTTVRFVIALVVLLPPTTLMGATLPLLIEGVRVESQWATRGSIIYAVNTLGAMVGAGLTGLVLLPHLGTRATILAAAGGSTLAAAIVLLALGKKFASRDATPVGEETLTLPKGLPLPALLACASGFGALASEVVWTRVLRSVVQGTTQAFAAMLVIYLCGIAAGTAIANILAKRIRPALRAFAFSQVAIVLSTVWGVLAARQLPRVIGLLQGRPDLIPHDAGVVLIAATFVLLPVALTLGASVPLAWHAANESGGDAGREAGRVLAWNTAGGLFGSLLTGFFLIPTLGTDGTIAFVALLHAIIAAVAFRVSNERPGVVRVVWVSIPLLLVALFIRSGASVDLRYLLFAQSDPNTAMFGGPNSPKWAESIRYLREGRNTTVTLRASANGVQLHNDGRPESGFSAGEPGFGHELIMLGSVANLLAEQRDRAMVIGLGAGHTTAVLLAAPWKRVDVVELEAAVVDAAERMYAARRKPFPLKDPRTRLIVDDARARLQLSAPGTYDAVVSQPSHPWLAGSSALYTREFFQEAKRALRPGGVLCIWVNLFRMDLPRLKQIVGTFRGVFPSVYGFATPTSSFLLVGSARPYSIGARMAERLAGDQGQSPFLKVSGLSHAPSFLAWLELDETGATAFGRGTAPIIDDRPSLEFELARLPANQVITPAQFDEVAPPQWLSPATIDTFVGQVRHETFAIRIQRMSGRGRALERIARTFEQSSMEPAPREYIAALFALAAGNDSRAAISLTTAHALPEAGRLRAALALNSRNYNGVLGSPAHPSDIMLRAAAATEDTTLITMIVRRPDARDVPYAKALAQFALEGCPGVLALPDAEKDALYDTVETAALLVRCTARSSADTHTLGRVISRAAVAYRGSASARASRGAECSAIGSANCVMNEYAAALEHNPAHPQAALGLARALMQSGRRAEAERLIRSSMRIARPLRGATEALAQGARELQIRTDEPIASAPSASSADIGAPNVEMSAAAD